MKKQAEIIEVEDEGLVSLLGKNVTFYCMNYIYTGKLVDVNETCVLLENPMIVYDTGSYTEEGWSDAQALPNKEFYIQISAIESFGILK